MVRNTNIERRRVFVKGCNQTKSNLIGPPCPSLFMSLPILPKLLWESGEKDAILSHDALARMTSPPNFNARRVFLYAWRNSFNRKRNLDLWRALRREGGAAGMDFARGGGRDRRVRVAPSVVWMVPPDTKGVNACAGSSGRLETRSSFARSDVLSLDKRRSFVERSLSAPKPCCGDDDGNSGVRSSATLLSLLEIGVWIFACMLLRTSGSPTNIFWREVFVSLIVMDDVFYLDAD